LIRRRGFPRLFIGWWTVLATGIIGFFGYGFVNHGFSALFKPIASELGLSRAVASTAASVQHVGRAIFAPTGGLASDKYGPRLIILIGIFCLALGLIMMYFIGSFWAFLVVWGLVIGAGFTLGCTIITDKAIVNWFVKRSGTAINTKFIIFSLSGLLLLPRIAWLIETQGWRMTCIISGVIIALVCFPLAWFFIKPHPPEYYGLLPDGAATKGEANEGKQIVDKGINYADNAKAMNFTLRQTMKTPSFWLIIVAGYITGIVMPVMNVHCIPFLTDMGIDPIRAATMMGFMVTVGIPTRLVTGPIVDRIKTNHLRFIMVTGHFLQAIGVATFLVNNSIATIYVWFLLYGIGSAASFGVELPMLARYFGRKAYGSILGLWLAMNTPIGLVAPIYVGWVYDTTGSYMSIFGLLAILTAVSGVVACFILPPKPPIQATDIHTFM